MRRTSLMPFALMGLMFMLGSLSGADEEAKQLQALTQKVAPSIVTVQVVLKMEWSFQGQSQSHEYKTSLQGVLVTPDGLVMLNNMPFSASRLKEMMGGVGEEMPGYKMNITPTSFKVVVEREEKEYDAFLVATESTLDLAFLKMEGLGERRLTPVDFNQTVDVTIGQKVVSVGRLSKGFDYAPYFATAQVCSEIAKPRKAWMLDGHINEVGLPVYTLNGEPVGVLTTLSSGVKEEGSDEMGFGFMPWMAEGGMSNRGMFLIPGSAIKGLIEQASKRAAELAAERAKRKGEKPAPEKPKPGAKGKP